VPADFSREEEEEEDPKDRWKWTPSDGFDVHSAAQQACNFQKSHRASQAAEVCHAFDLTCPIAWLTSVADMECPIS